MAPASRLAGIAVAWVAAMHKMVKAVVNIICEGGG